MRIMGFAYHWISGQKNHISSEMARELIAIYRTMYHLRFLVYQRVLPQLHLHLLLHHLHQRIPYLMSTYTPKIQYQKEVEVRVESFGETHCINKKGQREEVQIYIYIYIYRMNCLIGYRNSGTRAENFGDLTITDHKILSEEGESRNNHGYAVVVQDLGTQWIQSYPCNTKSSQETTEEPDEVAGANEETKSHSH